MIWKICKATNFFLIMKRFLLFITFFTTLSVVAQNSTQHSFWYKDSKYVVFQDSELEVVCYAEKINRYVRDHLAFHFNIFNLTKEDLLIQPNKITISVKDSTSKHWEDLKLMSSKEFYRFKYTPENHHHMSNDDFSMDYTYYVKTVEKEVNDSTKTTEQKVVLVPKKIPERRNVINKTHMSTRYLGKTSLIEGRYASGILLSRFRYREMVKKVKIVIEMEGHPKKEILINLTED